MFQSESKKSRSETLTVSLCLEAKQISGWISTLPGCVNIDDGAHPHDFTNVLLGKPKIVVVSSIVEARFCHPLSQNETRVYLRDPPRLKTWIKIPISNI